MAGSGVASLERLIYKLTGVNEDHEMRWTEYSIAMLLFSAVSMLVLYLLMANASMLRPHVLNRKGSGIVALTCL